MDTLLSMKVFRQVAEQQSFVRAAERLNLSPAMTSKHIQHLEEYLGVRLLHRTSRRVSLTQEGKLYFERCSEILHELDATEAALRQASHKPRGVLQIAAPVWMHQRRFTEALAAYCRQYPEVRLDLNLEDRVVDLVEESVDLALRVTAEPHSNLIARRICPMPIVIVGSKRWLDAHGRPQRPEELSHYPMIVNHSLRVWNSLSYLGPDGPRQLQVKPVLQTNNTSLIAQAAASGIGLAVLPEWLLDDLSLSQELEIVLPEIRWPEPFYLYAVYTSRRFQSPKVRSFIDHMLAWFKPGSHAGLSF